MIRLKALLKLLQGALTDNDLLGQLLDGVTMPRLNRKLAGLINIDPSSTDSFWALASMAAPYERHTLSKDLLVSLVCRAYTFKKQLEAGIAPSLWDGSTAKAAMYCRSVQKVTAKKPSLQLNCLCLLGAPAGLQFKFVLSRNYIEYLLGKQLGLSYRKYNSPASYIAGCYFQCLVQENTVAPKAAEIEATQVMKDLNRKMADVRLSLSKCKTPQLDCDICPKKRKECKFSPYE